MQTFVPNIEYGRCAADLDVSRLGKQRSETLQILDSIVNGTGYVNHPVNQMWVGYEPSLITYGLVICHEWRIVRGHSDSTWGQLAKWAQEFDMLAVDSTRDPDTWPAPAERPPWLGDKWVHRSHRSNLIRKVPHLYGKKYPGTFEDMPYFWPHNDPMLPGGYELRLSREDMKRLDTGERKLPPAVTVNLKTRVVTVPGTE